MITKTRIEKLQVMADALLHDIKPLKADENKSGEQYQLVEDIETEIQQIRANLAELATTL